MDPNLLAAIQKLMVARKNAADVGEPIPPEAEESFLRRETQGKFGRDAVDRLGSLSPTNAAIAAVQGATFGFGDNIVNLLDPKGKAGEEMRTREQLFRSQHPYLDPVLNVAGGLASGGLAARALKALGLVGDASTIGQAAKQGAVAGASFGALQGAGDADGPNESRLGGAARGAGIGAVTGGLLGAGTGGVAAAIDPARHGTSRILSAIGQEGGVPAVRARLDAMTAAGRGDEVMLADLGPHLRQSLDYAANGSDNVLVPAAEALDARSGGRAGRLLDDVRRGLPWEPDASLRAAELKANTRKVGKEAYGAIEDANPTFDASGLPLDKPLISTLWGRARLAGNISGTGPLDELVAKITEENPSLDRPTAEAAANQIAGAQAADAGVPAGSSERPTSLADLMNLRRGLSGQIDQAYGAGNGELGQTLKEIRDHVNAVLNQGAPGMADADAAYKRAKDLERVLASGRDWWAKSDVNEFSRVFSGIAADPDQLTEFRRGLASHLVEELQNAATNSDKARELMQRSDALDQKLKVVFGDRQTFDDFINRAKAERELSKAATAVSGSQTARRLAARGVAPEHLAIDAIQRGPISTILDRTFGAARQAMTRRTAEAMGGPLLTQGTANLDALLRQIAQRPPLVRSTATIGAPAGLLSLLDGSGP